MCMGRLRGLLMYSRLNTRGRPGRPTRTGRAGAAGADAASPPEFVSYEYTDLANSGTTVNIPAHEAGDIGLAILYRDSSVPGLPAGWTNVLATTLVSVSFRVCYKALDGAETTLTAATSVFQAGVAVFRGVDQFASGTWTNGSSGSWDAPAGHASDLTPHQLDVVILGVGDDINNPGGPAGFTLADWSKNISGSDESLGCWYKVGSSGSQYAGETDVAAMIDNWTAITTTGLVS